MARKPKRDLTVEEQLARGPLDLPFLMLVLLLLGIGLIMMFSASYATAYYTDGDPLVYISRQALFGAVGVVGMFVVSKINYQTFRWMSMPALIGSIVLLVLVFTPLGVTHNQARRWLKLGSGTRRSASAIKTGPLPGGCSTAWSASDFWSWCPMEPFCYWWPP